MLMNRTDVDWPLTSANTALVSRWAVGVQALELNPASEEGAVDFASRSIAALPDQDRTALRVAIMAFRPTAELVTSIFGVLTRTVRAPAAGVTLEFLSSTIRKHHEVAQRSQLVHQAMLALYSLALRRYGLMSKEDLRMVVMRKHDLLFPSAQDLLDDIAYTELHSKVRNFVVTARDQVATGHVLVDKLRASMRTIIDALTFAPEAQRSLKTVWGGLRQYLARVPQHPHRHRSPQFEAVKLNWTMSLLALDDHTPREYLADDDYTGWGIAMADVATWLGSEQSDYRVESLETVSSWYRVQRIFNERHRDFVMMSVRPDTAGMKTSYATAAVEVPLDDDFSYFRVKEDVSAALRRTSESALKAFDQTIAEALVETVYASSPDLVRSTFLSLGTRELWHLSASFSAGFEVELEQESDIESPIDIRLHANRVEMIDPVVVIQRGVQMMGERFRTRDPLDVLRYAAIIDRPNNPYPVRTQTPERFLGQSLVHRQSITMRDVGAPITLRIIGGIAPGKTRRIDVSLPTLLNLRQLSADLKVFPNPAVAMALNSSLRLIVGTLAAARSSRDRRDVAEMGAVQMLKQLIATPEVRNAAWRIARSGGSSSLRLDKREEFWELALMMHAAAQSFLLAAGEVELSLLYAFRDLTTLDDRLATLIAMTMLPGEQIT